MPSVRRRVDEDGPAISEHDVARPEVPVDPRGRPPVVVLTCGDPVADALDEAGALEVEAACVDRAAARRAGPVARRRTRPTWASGRSTAADARSRRPRASPVGASRRPARRRRAAGPATVRASRRRVPSPRPGRAGRGRCASPRPRAPRRPGCHGPPRPPPATAALRPRPRRTRAVPPPTTCGRCQGLVGARPHARPPVDRRACGRRRETLTCRPPRAEGPGCQALYPRPRTP